MTSLQKSLPKDAQTISLLKASEKRLQEQIWKLESKCMVLEEEHQILWSKISSLEKKMNE